MSNQTKRTNKYFISFTVESIFGKKKFFYSFITLKDLKEDINPDEIMHSITNLCIEDILRVTKNNILEKDIRFHVVSLLDSFEQNSLIINITDPLSEFKRTVQPFCNPKDFSKNQDELKVLKSSSYETFISLLKLGGAIMPCIKAVEEISKLSVQTNLDEKELIKLSTRFRFINGLIDEKD